LPQNVRKNGESHHKQKFTANARIISLNEFHDFIIVISIHWLYNMEWKWNKTRVSEWTFAVTLINKLLPESLQFINSLPKTAHHVKLEIWGKAQHESTRHPKSDWREHLGGW